MAMYREKRFEEIKKLLAARSELSIEDIMKAVGVARDTARRDIVALDAQGVATVSYTHLTLPTIA